MKEKSPQKESSERPYRVFRPAMPSKPWSINHAKKLQNYLLDPDGELMAATVLANRPPIHKPGEDINFSAGKAAGFEEAIQMIYALADIVPDAPEETEFVDVAKD